MTRNAIQNTLKVVNTIPAINHLATVVNEFYHKSDKAAILDQIKDRQSSMIANSQPRKPL